MSNVLIGLLGMALALNQVQAASNFAERTRAGTSIPVSPGTNDPVEREYEALLEQDDAAQEEVDQWIRDNQAFQAKGAGVPAQELNQRIHDRFQPVVKAYEDFIQRHPEHSRVRVAYASFLGDTGHEEEAQTQLEKALQLDTNNPAIYNNLANIYGHTGPVRKAFEFYSKAIQLEPSEPVYYHNFGTTVYLFRTDAKEFYGIDEQQVFDKAFQLYSNAMRLDPTNFPLASDVAQSYYGVKPLRAEAALTAWTNALHLAHDEIEREGVYVHFARVKMLDQRYREAREQLNRVTNSMYAELKKRLGRAIDNHERESRTNNATASAGEK